MNVVVNENHLLLLSS